MRCSFILRTISLQRRSAAVSPDLPVSGGPDKFYVMFSVSLHHSLAIFKVVLWCFRRWWCVESSPPHHRHHPSFPAVANSPTVLYLTTFSFVFRRTLLACGIRAGVDVVADLSLVGSDLAVGVCWSVFGVAVSQRVWWFGADPEVLCGFGVVVAAVLPFSA
jgi:hypothetical protein